jgi:hypothetical protein
LGIAHLDQGPGLNRNRKVGIIVRQDRRGQFSEVRQFVVADIAALVLRKTLSKHGSRVGAQQHDCTISARLSLPLAGDTQFQNAATEIGVNQSLLYSCNRRLQHGVAQPSLPGEAAEELRLEDPHSALYSTQCVE